MDRQPLRARAVHHPIIASRTSVRNQALLQQSKKNLITMLIVVLDKAIVHRHHLEQQNRINNQAHNRENKGVKPIGLLKAALLCPTKLNAFRYLATLEKL